MQVAAGYWFNGCHVLLVQSPTFQAVSGPHLTAVACSSSFVLCAPPQAFPKLQQLGYVRTRLAHGLPPSLQWLGIKVGCLMSSGLLWISCHTLLGYIIRACHQ